MPFRLTPSSKACQTTHGPTFLIAGAPKCGTTAIYEYLRQHPQVYLTVPKEPHVFAEDLGRHREVPSYEDYVRLFDGVQPSHRAVGDASPWYLHSTVALPRIRAELSSDLKIILALRSPVEFVASLHSDMVWICFEDESDLGRAWELQEARRDGKHVPNTCLVPMFLQYRQLGRFRPYVEKVLSMYPRSQVKMILLDDLKCAPQTTYAEVLEFLELDPHDDCDFRCVNPASQNRFSWLARQQNRLQYALPNWLSKSAKQCGLGALNRAVKRLNTARCAKRLISEELRRRMLADFLDDIEALEDVIGRDLSAWKR